MREAKKCMYAFRGRGISMSVLWRVLNIRVCVYREDQTPPDGKTQRSVSPVLCYTLCYCIYVKHKHLQYTSVEIVDCAVCRFTRNRKEVMCGRVVSAHMCRFHHHHYHHHQHHHCHIQHDKRPAFTSFPLSGSQTTHQLIAVCT